MHILKFKYYNIIRIQIIKKKGEGSAVIEVKLIDLVLIRNLLRIQYNTA